MKVGSMTLSLLILPSLVAGQDDRGDLRSSVERLLDVPDVESLLESMDDRFVQHFLMLVPDLPSEDREVLSAAVEEAFRPSALRASIASAMAEDASADVVEQVVKMRRSGAQAELRNLMEAYEPEQPVEEFLAGMGDADRERLQLMASLTEARGQSDLALMLDDVMGRMAHELVNALGGAFGDFEPIADDAYDAAYRDHTLRLALESLHRLQPASDELIRAVLEEHRSQPAQWFADAYTTGLLVAVQAAGQRVATLTMVDAPADAETGNPDSGMPCRAQPCGFLVEWEGREPSGMSQVYGVPGDLERLVHATLAGAGYALVLGQVDEGLNIQLRPRAERVYCEVVTGTDNRTCLAVGQVRVALRGSHRGIETPASLIVRNRCGANSVMAVQGIAALVAARIHHELTTYPGDERRVPSC